jgi:hypothetical protein
MRQPALAVNVSSALGIAQRAHSAAVSSGADLFSLLKLEPASLARELPSLASMPAPPPGYSAVPTWKVWQDF